MIRKVKIIHFTFLSGLTSDFDLRALCSVALSVPVKVFLNNLAPLCIKYPKGEFQKLNIIFQKIEDGTHQVIQMDVNKENPMVKVNENDQENH